MIGQLFGFFTKRRKREPKREPKPLISDKMRKSMARMQWQISWASPDKTYKNKYSADQMTFTPNVINAAKDFVKEQEKINPVWDTWVEEWKNE